MGALYLLGLSLVSFLSLANLFARSLLFFGLFLLHEFAARFLHEGSSISRVDFAARAQSEALVKRRAEGCRGGHGVDGGRDVGWREG